jgi:hypothetical protein
MVGTYRSMETKMAKIDDADVVPGCTDYPVEGMASSVPLMVMGSKIDMVEETNGSKANNAEGNKISEVESSIARESSSMGLALNFQVSRG